MSRTMFALLSSVAGLALAGAAAAQESTALGSAPATGLQAEGTVVEEIIVRSQRRDERLIDVPIQVTALDGQDLAEQQILTLEDLQNKAPGVYFGGSSNGTAITVAVRGVGGSVTVFGEEPVAVFFDDQFLARGANTSDLLDVDSIEILRGPQGTLYGRNATAGAVLLRSRRPGLDDFTGQGRLTIAQHDEQRVEAAVGGPIVENRFGFRMAGLYSHAGGYGDNLAKPGERLGKTESARLRGSLTWTADDATEVFGLVEAGTTQGAGAQARWSIDSSNAVRIPSSRIAVHEDRDFSLNSPQSFEGEDLRALASIRRSFDSFDLVVEAGYTFADVSAATDSDGTGLSLLFNRGRFEDQTYTQDLRLVSNGEGALTWVAGLSILQNRFQMPYFYIRNVTTGLDLGFFSKLNTRATAAYAEGTYGWDNGLSLTLGLRATREAKEAEVDRYFVVVASRFVIDPPMFLGEETWENLSPRAVLEYRLTEGVNLYASYSRGFKGGGFNAFGPDPSYAPETITALEVGTKARLLEGRLSLSAAAFSYDYQDLQVRLGVPAGGVAIASAEGADLRGVEAEFTARPFQGLEVSGSIALLDTEYRSFLTPNLAGTLVNAAGGRLNRAPEVQYSLGAAYGWDLTPDLVARVSASMNHIGDVTFTPTDQASAAWRGDAYTEVDLRASIAAPASGWELAAFVQNATDEFAVTAIVAAGNFPVASFNKPRTIGLELARRF